MKRGTHQDQSTQEDERLRHLLDDYIHAYMALWAGVTRDVIRRSPHRPLTAELVKIAEEMHELLRPTKLYANFWELPQRIHDVLTGGAGDWTIRYDDVLDAIVPAEGEDPDEADQYGYEQYLVDIETELKKPRRPYVFTTPVAFRGREFLSELMIGGAAALRLVTAPADSPFSPEDECIALSGVVNAVTRYSAAKQVEELLLEVTGVGYALRFFDFDDLLPGVPLGVGWIDIGEDDPLRPCQEGERAAMTCRVVVPESVSDLDAVRARKDGLGSVLNRLLKTAVAILRSDEERAAELRHVARLLLKTRLEPDLGPKISAGFVCLEAALLDPKARESVGARLGEAVAYRLGRSAAERVDLRKQVAALYDIRSRYVHTGRSADGSKIKDPAGLIVELARAVVELEISEWTEPDDAGRRWTEAPEFEDPDSWLTDDAEP